MSQWGESRIVQGVTMVPLVDGPSFQPLLPHQLVTHVICTHFDDAKSITIGPHVLERARRLFIGQPYAMWISNMRPNTEFSGAAAKD